MNARFSLDPYVNATVRMIINLTLVGNLALALTKNIMLMRSAIQQRDISTEICHLLQLQLQSLSGSDLK